MRRRRKSYNIPGHAHELTFTCYRGHKFFQSERTCQWLTDAMNAARIELDFAVWAFVFMPEHIHLIIYPRREIYDMAEILAALKEPVGRHAFEYLEAHAPAFIPKLTRKRGTRTERLFWQSGGGYDRNIDNPRTLWRMIDYLHANPIRRGLVRLAHEWKWSSAAFYAGVGDSPIPINPPAEGWALQ